MMKTHQYKGGYEEYLETQRRTTDRKRRKQWATEGDLSFVARILVRRNWPRRAGLCHGTRSGREQRWLMEHLDQENESVIGTELNPGPRSDPSTIRADFNLPRSEWVGQFSFIYSNSFDHAFDPEATLKVWAGQLERGGTIIIEHTRMHVRPSATDPTGGTPEEYADLIRRCGLVLVDTLVYKAPDNTITKRYFIIRNPS